MTQGEGAERWNHSFTPSFTLPRTLHPHRISAFRIPVIRNYEDFYRIIHRHLRADARRRLFDQGMKSVGESTRSTRSRCSTSGCRSLRIR